MRRRLLAFLLATVLTALLATVVATQFVLAGIGSLGVVVPLGVRLSATAHDLLGMGPTFAALVGGGFLLALPVAGLLARLDAVPRVPVFALAGAAALATILAVMKLSFGLTPIAAARGAGGFVALALCGAVGGAVFARLVPGRRHD